jgi:hypothetical protein
MRPGPTQIKKCTSCEGLISQSTVASGNTFGAKFWTDGVMHAPMLPVTPQLAKCPHCASIVFLQNLELVEEREFLRPFELHIDEPNEEPFEVKQHHSAKTYERANFLELIKFVNNNKLSSKVERIARIQAWRSGNDTRRSSDTPGHLANTEITNLEQLLPLLDQPHDYSNLVKVEVLRNLGRFDEASQVFYESDFNRNEEDAAQLILELIESSDTQVCEITREDDREWRILRRKRARDTTEQKTIEVDPTGPPILEIKSRDWWIMVIGMFSHDWALIDDLADGTSIAYFMKDSDGMDEFFEPKLKGRVAVFNSISFPNRVDAEQGLRLMGFDRLEDKPGPWDGVQPDGVFYISDNYLN